MKNRRKIRKENMGKPVRIVVECVYLGGQSMEDAFRRINEDGRKRTVPVRWENLEEIMKKSG